MAADRMNGHKDWASIGWGQLAGWGLPAIAIIAAGAFDQKAVVWPVSLEWLGGA